VILLVFYLIILLQSAKKAADEEMIGYSRTSAMLRCFSVEHSDANGLATDNVRSFFVSPIVNFRAPFWDE
jgi:hypothetical protein